jgi:4-carboxymuconolactone decarboxylase
MNLEPSRRLLIEISAALAARDTEGLEAALARAAGGGCDRSEVEEALLQSHLFLGYPAALTALASWRNIGGPPAAETDPLAAPETVAAWTGRGVVVCERVYGRAYGKLRGNIARAHPAMDRWMVTEGYGKVLGRPGLDLRTRELCIVAILAVTGWEPQLHSHMRGAMHAGAPPADVEAALEIGLRHAHEADATAARELWQRVARAHGHGARHVH